MKFVFCAALMISFSLFANLNSAQADPVADELHAAEQAYSHRGSSDGNQQVDHAIELLKDAYSKASDLGVKYDVLILWSRALSWKGGTLSDDSARMNLYQQGQAKADEAIGLDSGYAEGYYYAGVNLGEWADLAGKLSAMGKVKQIQNYFGAATQVLTRKGQHGESIDGYGPRRALGRIFYKLPSWLGGDYNRALSELKTAFENAPNYAINVVYYADALKDGDDTQIALAKQILDQMLAQDPAKFNPDRVAETMDEFAEGRALRAKIQ